MLVRSWQLSHQENENKNDLILLTSIFLIFKLEKDPLHQSLCRFLFSIQLREVVIKDDVVNIYTLNLMNIVTIPSIDLIFSIRDFFAILHRKITILVFSLSNSSRLILPCRFFFSIRISVILLRLNAKKTFFQPFQKNKKPMI